MGRGEVSASGHEDPEDEPPWAMQLVVRVERARPPTHIAVCEAAAMAVLRLLTDPRAAEGGDWHADVARWESGRIRKVTRRARGARWDAAGALPGVTVEHRGAEVRAFVPAPVTDLPPELSRLQVAGLDLIEAEAEADAEPDAGAPAPDPPYVLISLNPRVKMTTGKAAAQCGHAAQLLLWEHAIEGPLPVRVIRPSAAQWDADDAGTGPAVAVHDAGFTEVAPGTVTARARLAI